MKKLAKKIKKLFFSDKGAVSIFAILIILPIFILNALLIDTLRIMSAERKIENAMDAALRSTFSKFDSSLADVGLFAYNGGTDEASSQFKSYVDKQFAGLEGFDNLSIPTINNAKATFDDERNLVDYDVFTHQVLESMKYQAPVQLGKDFVELLMGGKGISEDEIDEVEKLVENYEEILGLMKKRNAKVDTAKKQIDQYLNVIKSGIKDKVIGSKVTSGSNKIPANLKTFNQLIFYVDRYKELKEKEADKNEKLSDEEKDEIDNFEKALNKDVFKSIFDVEVYHEDIPKPLLGNNGTLPNPAEDSAKGYDDKIKGMIGQNEEMLKALKKFTLSDKFFKEILEASDIIYESVKLGESSESDLNRIGSLSIGELYGLFYIAMEAKNKQAGQMIIDTMEDKLDMLKKKQVKTIESHMSDYEKAKQELENVDTKKEEDKADKSFGELWAELNKFNDIVNQIAQDNATYAELDQIILQYDGNPGGNGDASEPSRLQFIKDAFTRFKEFVEFIQGFPDSVRNELYINEYILANYGTKEPYELGKANAYAYSTKKAQYITYGHNTAGMNYFMFIRDIVLILFVANLLSQVVKGGFAGPLAFFRALGFALASTVNDLIKLTKKPYNIQWSPFKKAKITVTMPMFLRIIMAMKSTSKPYNKEKLRRLQAVITKETDANLLTSPSYITGNVNAKLKLWFIPQLAEVLPGGKVEGSYYIFEKKKVYSY